MGKRNKLRKSQSSLPHNIPLSDFINALISENYTNLDDLHIYKRDLRGILTKYFNLTLEVISRNKFSSVNSRKIQNFLNYINLTLIINSENQLNSDFTNDNCYAPHPTESTPIKQLHNDTPKNKNYMTLRIKKTNECD